MRKSRVIFQAVLASLLLLGACSGNKTESPYSEIYAQPAFAGLTDSIAKEPKNDSLYFRRAVLLNQKGFPEPALADFKKAWSIRKDERYAYGVSTLMADNRPDSAILFLNEALKVLPNSFLLQLNLAHAYTSKNETDKALDVCEQILAKNPQQVDVMKLKADLLGKKGEQEKAVKMLEAAYALTPFDIELNYILALKYAETKNKRVLALCDSLITSDTLGFHADPYYYKGIYYSNINEKAKALALFDEAMRHDYNFLDAYIEKGAILFEMKKYNEAINVFNRALTISPQFPDSYYWIGKCQQALGKKDDAKLNYQRAFSLDNSFAAAKDSANKLK